VSRCRPTAYGNRVKRVSDTFHETANISVRNITTTVLTYFIIPINDQLTSRFGSKRFYITRAVCPDGGKGFFAFYVSAELFYSNNCPENTSDDVGAIRSGLFFSFSVNFALSCR